LVLLAALVNIYRYNYLFGTDIITETIDIQFNAISQFISQLPAEQLAGRFGGLTNESALSIYQQLNSLLDEIRQVYYLMFPSLLILNYLAIVFIVYMLIKQVLRIFKRDVSKYPEFSQLILQRSAAIALAVSYVLPFFMSNTLTLAAVNNISAIIGGVAFICGVSFIDFRLRQRVKNAWLRFALYIAVFFISFTIIGIIAYILILVAAFDSFVDYRHLRKKDVASG
jgi:uncharacterized membrane protein